MLPLNSASKGSQIALLFKHCITIPVINMAARPSIFIVLGLGFLYASPYFLPLTGSRAYFLPSNDIFGLVLVPSIVGVAFACSVMACGYSIHRVANSPLMTTICSVIGLSILTLVTLKGFSAIVGYDWESKAPIGHDLVVAQRFIKIIAFLIVFSCVWSLRASIGRLSRILSSIGFAFVALAAIRMIILVSGQVTTDSHIVSAVRTDQVALSGLGESPRSAIKSPVSRRRVVWVIFDETDFLRVYSSVDHLHSFLPNFERLARMAVFATNAMSPASATLYSVPSLLTGLPLVGEGVHETASGGLVLESTENRLIPFEQESSIFGKVAAMGLTSSILGFYHPYCRLFEVSKCDSFSWPEIGNLYSAIWANVPDSVATRLGRVDPWVEITKKSLGLLPQYLAQKDALTFIHLNFPHLPASYADQVSKLKASGEPLEEYSRNLGFTDGVLGEIVDSLAKQVGDRDVLLVVSTDHWLRNMWYQVGLPETGRRIPLIVWKVGDNAGTLVGQTINSVDTSQMVLEFLGGKITSQSQIADWWSSRPQYSTYIVGKR